jgi:DNA-binding MarR family transcriptional regulator
MCNKDNLGYLLSKASRMTRWDLTNNMAEEGITSAQWGLIRDIYTNELLCKTEEEKYQRLTPAAIAERLHSDRPTISSMVERMVKNGLAYRVSNPKDRRSQIILLTDRTKALMPKLEALGEVTMKKATKDFSEAEVAQLKQLLQRIIDNLS